MAKNPDELHAKMVQIASRYLDRVTREIVQLRALVDSAASSDMKAVGEVEALTHRMHGSGAMLHFDEISGHAGELERMAAGFIAAGQIDLPRMQTTLEKLQAAIDKACANRASAS